MKKKKFSLRGIDEKTAEMIEKKYPAPVDAESLFEKSYSDFLGESASAEEPCDRGEVNDLERADKRRKLPFFTFNRAVTAFAVIAAALIIKGISSLPDRDEAPPENMVDVPDISCAASTAVSSKTSQSTVTAAVSDMPYVTEIPDIAPVTAAVSTSEKADENGLPEAPVIPPATSMKAASAIIPPKTTTAVMTVSAVTAPVTTAAAAQMPEFEPMGLQPVEWEWYEKIKYIPYEDHICDLACEYPYIVYCDPTILFADDKKCVFSDGTTSIFVYDLERRETTYSANVWKTLMSCDSAPYWDNLSFICCTEPDGSLAVICTSSVCIMSQTHAYRIDMDANTITEMHPISSDNRRFHIPYKGILPPEISDDINGYAIPIGEDGYAYLACNDPDAADNDLRRIDIVICTFESGEEQRFSPFK